MYRTFCGILLFALALHGQTAADIVKLTPAVSKALLTAGAADDTASQALTDASMAVSFKAHPPTRQQVVDFSNALRGAAAGKPANATQLSIVSRCILNILRSRGLSNFALAAQLRSALTALQTNSQKIDLAVQRYIAIGEAVRGPDALPANVIDPATRRPPQK